MDDLLDTLESSPSSSQRPVSSGPARVPPIRDAEDRINRIFERFRFGFRMENGQVRKIGSPVLEEKVVGPALLSVQRHGWQEAERSFREALAHQRGGETDDALTAANAAVEAALKAAGLSDNTRKELARLFNAAGIVPGYLSNVPDLLEDLLTVSMRFVALLATLTGKRREPPRSLRSWPTSRSTGPERSSRTSPTGPHAKPQPELAARALMYP